MRLRRPERCFDHRIIVGVFRHGRHCRTTDPPIAKSYLACRRKPTSAVLVQSTSAVGRTRLIRHSRKKTFDAGSFADFLIDRNG
jgi:hypothetical protein